MSRNVAETAAGSTHIAEHVAAVADTVQNTHSAVTATIDELATGPDT
ncbi:hypothetical protein [Actinoplanes sp. NPDC049118]